MRRPPAALRSRPATSVAGGAAGARRRGPGPRWSRARSTVARVRRQQDDPDPGPGSGHPCSEFDARHRRQCRSRSASSAGATLEPYTWRRADRPSVAVITGWPGLGDDPGESRDLTPVGSSTTTTSRGHRARRAAGPTRVPTAGVPGRSSPWSMRSPGPMPPTASRRGARRMGGRSGRCRLGRMPYRRATLDGQMSRNAQYVQAR